MKVLAPFVVLIVAISGWWMLRDDSVRLDLIAQFTQARKDGAPLFSLVDAGLAGETKKAIVAPPNSRIHFWARVPDDGRLKMSIGIQPGAWSKEGSAVYFFVGVTGSNVFEVHFERTLNPFKNRSERRWIPITIDLSVYAGDDVELLMNTRASGTGVIPTDGLHNDLPLWGAPEIVGR